MAGHLTMTHGNAMSSKYPQFTYSLMNTGAIDRFE